MFTGAYATEAYSEIFNATGATGVPVEGNEYGPGTADSHWDEATFNTELMTGFIDWSGNYISGMTVASLEDLGYATVWTHATNPTPDYVGV